MHSNSLGIYPCPCILFTPVCSKTRQCTWYWSRIKREYFKLSLHKETMDKVQNDWKKGDTHLLKLLIGMYKLNPSCSGVYLSQVYGTWSIHKACTMYHVHFLVYMVHDTCLYILLLIKLCDKNECM